MPDSLLLGGRYTSRCGRPRSIENSLRFGVFDGLKQVGFARVRSDFATYAYLGDVFILEPYRGLGLAKSLMECIVWHPQLQGFGGGRWPPTTRISFMRNSDSAVATPRAVYGDA